MKIALVLSGKTRKAYLGEGMKEYAFRIRKFNEFEIRVLPDIKFSSKSPEEKIKLEEGRLILKSINPGDYVILLDERGKQYSSAGLAELLEKRMIHATKSVIFVIGGPYGFSSEVYKRSDLNLSLSKMTFSHQLVRLIFLEQLYRGFTIIRGSPYHHE